MSKHKDVYVYSSDLIDLIMGWDSDYRDEETADLLDADLEQNDDGEGNVYFTIVDPECWYRVSWPEHVITPKYNSNATYGRIDTADVMAIVDAYKQIHSRSVTSQKLY